MMYCHAGCTTKSIVDALGLTVADLMPQADRPVTQTITATYDYRDEQGNLLYQACRKTPKGFSQRAPAPGGGWLWSLSGVRRVLYRLPELLAEPDATVYICEGEKDADNLAALATSRRPIAAAPESGLTITRLRCAGGNV